MKYVWQRRLVNCILCITPLVSGEGFSEATCKAGFHKGSHRLPNARVAVHNPAGTRNPLVENLLTVVALTTIAI
jgi:hypothetical protein